MPVGEEVAILLVSNRNVDNVSLTSIPTSQFGEIDESFFEHANALRFSIELERKCVCRGLKELDAFTRRIRDRIIRINSCRTQGVSLLCRLRLSRRRWRRLLRGLLHGLVRSLLLS